MQSPPFPRYLIPPRSKYSPHHHILKHPQLPFLPCCQRPGFTPIQNNRQNYISIYCVAYVSKPKWREIVFTLFLNREKNHAHQNIEIHLFTIGKFFSHIAYRRTSSLQTRREIFIPLSTSIILKSSFLTFLYILLRFET